MSFCFLSAVAVRWRVTQLCSYVLSLHTGCCSVCRGIRISRNVPLNATTTRMREMQPVDNGMQHRSISLAAAAANLHSSSWSVSWDVSGGLDKCCLSQRAMTGSAHTELSHRVAVRCIAAGIGSSCSGCSLRKLKFIIEIRALQSTCLQIGKAAICSSIAICTSCLLPWYLPQSRSRSDWRRWEAQGGGDR